MNYTKEQFLEEIRKFIGTHKKEYSDNVLVRSAIVKDEKGLWVSCLTIFRILKNKEEIKIRDNMIYDIFILNEKIIDINEFIKIIEHLYVSSMHLNDYEIRFDGNLRYYSENYLWGNNEFSEWPGLCFIAAGNRVDPPNYPLVKYKIPLFRNGQEAMKEWFEFSDFRDYSDSRLGSFIIFLPNYKARIKNIDYKDGRLTIFVDGIIEEVQDLNCRVSIKEENRVIRKDVIISTEEPWSASFDLGDNAVSDVYIDLINKHEEKLDYYFENPFNHTGKMRLIGKGTDKEIRLKIGNGENEKIEFKPYINFRAKDKQDNNKEREIIKTVIAFANTSGGSILFGISKNSEILEIFPKLANEENQINFIEDFKKHLRKLISDKLNKGITLNFLMHDLSGGIILEMLIGEGNNKPYSSVDNNLIYIRRGSTNRIPNEEELKKLFSNILKV